MAKNISLKKKTSAELLSKVTGQSEQPLRVPPPATPAGIKGVLPTPSGTVRIGEAAPGAYTEAEKRVLAALNINENEEMPANLAEILAQHGLTQQQFTSMQQTKRVIRSDADTYIPPVPLDTPPVVAKTVDIETLSAERQQEIREAIAEARAVETENRVLRNQEAAVSTLPPDIQQAILDANDVTRVQKKAEPVPAKQVLAEQGQTETPQPARRAARPQTAPLPPPPAPVEKEKAPSTFTGDTLQNCPFCHHNLEKAHNIEPTPEDKLIFLQALLGEKQFVKNYSLYGGRLVAVFRALTVTELDALFRQINYDIQSNKLLDATAVEERLQRYRMCLQLVSLTSPTFRHEMPSGFTPATSPNAVTHWELPDDLATGDVGIGCVEEFILGTVIKTESVYRALSLVCNEFNRLNSKLEATGHDSDFWEAIELPR